jgi:hypothetical protein
MFTPLVLSNFLFKKKFKQRWSTIPTMLIASIPLSLLAATLYQGNPDSKHKLWNIVTTERYILHMQVLLECCYI